jgi:hypothetical protein
MTQNHVIGAVLSERSAASAATALDEAGLVEHVIVAKDDLPSDGRFGRGLLRGAAVGSMLVASGMVLLAALTSPPEARTVSLLTGFVAGAVAGAFLGGYVGVTRHRRRLGQERKFARMNTGAGEVLLLVDASAAPDQAEQILTRHGGRLVPPSRAE